MSLSDLLLFALRALSGHRLRTSLSLLGMSIGVAAVIILTALGEGTRDYVSDQFSMIGSNLIIVVPGRNETTGFVPGTSGVPNDLTLLDAQAVLRAVPEVIRAAPVVAATGSVSYGERRRQLAVMGTTEDILIVQDLRLARGGFLPPGDPLRGSSVAVLGSETARELFRGEDALGKRVRIGDRRFRVIGVLAPRGMQVGMNLDDIVMIPAATAMQLFNRSSLFRIILEVHAYADMERARRKIIDLMIERHGEEDITTLTQDAVVSTLSTILTALTLALAAIAAISLSVAGIGIMNVMLVSVAERTPEVGLLKALGVGRRQILAIFLTEAALLSTTGAALGVALGWGCVLGVVALYPALPASPPWWAIAAAMTVALVAGILFGVVPARRATALDPVVALYSR